MNDSWKTPALCAAEAELAAAVERGRVALLGAQRVAARIPATAITDEDIEQIERAARDRDASAEFRALADRVQRGELSWRQIVDGQAMDDPGVQAAMRANPARLAAVYRKFEEGYDLDEVLRSEAAAARPAGARAAAGAEHDEPEGSVLRHSSW